MDVSRSWLDMLRGVGLSNVLHVIVGFVRILLSMFFLNVHHMILRDQIFLTI